METIQYYSSFKQELQHKIENRTAKISIIGLGYIGLSLAVEAAKAGFHVFGVEDNPERCASVNNGINYIKDIHSEIFNFLIQNKMIQAVSNFKLIKHSDIVIICVPTPLNKNKEPDISHINEAIDGVCKCFGTGMLIILESTTYPGTTEEIIQKRIEKNGHKLGRDFFLAYSPERIDPGNKIYNTENTTKLVSGITTDCTQLCVAFYSCFIKKIIPVSSPRTAEMTKVFESIFRCVNIALVNELAMLCEQMDIDIYEVINSANSKPYGFHAFWPGPGVGGHCIPLDPYYLAWKSKEYNVRTRFIELAGEINENMPHFVLRKITEILNNTTKSLKNSSILQLGISYKKDTDDARESPAISIYNLLTQGGAHVDVVDPFITEFCTHDSIFTSRGHSSRVKTVKLTPNLIMEADIVLITTDHAEFPYTEIVKTSKVIFDTRNAVESQNISSNKVIKLSTRIGTVEKL